MRLVFRVLGVLATCGSSVLSEALQARGSVVSSLSFHSLGCVFTRLHKAAPSPNSHQEMGLVASARVFNRNRSWFFENLPKLLWSRCRILHKDGFSQQDLEMIRPVVYSNCIHCMLAILRAMFHLQIEYEDPERVVCFFFLNFLLFLFSTNMHQNIYICFCAYFKILIFSAEMRFIYEKRTRFACAFCVCAFPHLGHFSFWTL